ncbi:MAG: RHS repeat-associated core domain-containing protein [Pseudomonadales bacterium]|nr:RHS repeat-associated core domain-containing protein [Pseudomonadales bacterium]
MGGQRIAIVEGNGSTEDLYFTMNDHLGQTYALTNNDGTNSTIVYERADMPFGEMFAQYKLTSDYTEDENTRFPGQYYDKETGYYQNWHRDYDPMLGRYITSDPIGVLRDYKHDPELMLAIVAGVVDPPQGDGLNHPYAYVDQNPVNLIDPDGLAKWWKWFKPRPPDDTCANTQCTLTQCSVCCQGLKPRTTQCLIACQDQFINGPPNNCKEKDCKDKNSDGGDK